MSHVTPLQELSYIATVGTEQGGGGVWLEILLCSPSKVVLSHLDPLLNWFSEPQVSILFAANELY